RFEFDPLGRIRQIELQAVGARGLTGAGLAVGTALASFEYIGPSRLLRRALGNGTISSYGYDAGRRLASIEHRDGAGSIASVQHVYDGASHRRVERATPAPGSSVVFDFDALWRLTSARAGLVLPPVMPGQTQSAQDAYIASVVAAAAPLQFDYG